MREGWWHRDNGGVEKKVKEGLGRGRKRGRTRGGGKKDGGGEGYLGNGGNNRNIMKRNRSNYPKQTRLKHQP